MLVRDCKSKLKRENAYRFAVCFICKEEGHLAKVGEGGMIILQEAVISHFHSLLLAGNFSITSSYSCLRCSPVHLPDLTSHLPGLS